MLKKVLIVLSLVALFGCVKQPVIQDGLYVSNEHKFMVDIPEGWHATLEMPDWMPSELLSRNTRYTERAFFYNDDLDAVILIESKRLTWAKKYIHPLEITFDPNGPRMAKSVCDKLHVRRQEKFSKHPDRYEYEYYCFTQKFGALCPIGHECQESFQHVVFKDRNKFMQEQVYLAGKNPIAGEDAPIEAWRIHYVLYAPVDQENAVLPIYLNLISSTAGVQGGAEQ